MKVVPLAEYNKLYSQTFSVAVYHEKLQSKVRRSSLKNGHLRGFFVECGALKIGFSSRCKLGSLRSVGTAVVSPESTLCVHQNPRRLADESSIKRFNGSPSVNFPAKIQNFAY